jgi:hypothetical protein
MKRSNSLSLGLATFLLFAPEVLFAEFTMILKNGRRIVVQSYREEAGMIKFPAFGGEIGIAKEQIQTILKGSADSGQATVIPGTESSRAAPAREGARKPVAGVPEAGKAAEEERLTPEEQQAKEEKEYQEKVRQITQKLNATRERYSLLTRGKRGSEPGLLETEEAMKARTEDLTSRLRDVQNRPDLAPDAGGVSLSSPSAFTGMPPGITQLSPSPAAPSVSTPPPTYTQREKELSELRSEMSRLERERERLIEEMKRRNFETGGLFLD